VKLQERRPRGGLGGRSQKFEVGDGPCIRSPNILSRPSSVGCARKYEQGKKNGVIKEFFSEIVAVLVRKGSYTTLNIVNDTENLGKETENPKTGSTTKKGHKKNLASPQILRQVSATE